MASTQRFNTKKTGIDSKNTEILMDIRFLEFKIVIESTRNEFSKIFNKRVVQSTSNCSLMVFINIVNN